MQRQKNSFLRHSDKYWIGIALIGIIISIDTYLDAPKVISSRSGKLVTLETVLVENPIFDEYRVAEFTYDYYLKLRVIGYDKYFVCSRCSFKSLNLELAKKLKVGDSVRLRVFKNDVVNDVYGIVGKESGLILEYEDVVSCEKSKWEKPMIISIVILLIVISNSTIRCFKTN